MQQIVGPGAANDACGIKPESAADRLAQRRGRTVGVIFQTSGVSFDDSLKILVTPGALLLPGT